MKFAPTLALLLSLSILGAAEQRHESLVAAAKAEEAAKPGVVAPGPTKFETVPPGEALEIAEIGRLMVELLDQRYPDGMARRGVHPKTHGCIRASFTINPDIPENYRVGLFATPGKTYEAWVRFSNATPLLAPDVDEQGHGASRGMAIKVMGIEGPTLLGEPDSRAQDFLLINLPGFAFPNVAEYLAVTKIQVEHHDDIRAFFAPPLSPDRLKTLAIVQQLNETKVGNPLDVRYFSASPFLYGPDRVAKFAARPRNPENTPVPEFPSFDYLRQAMRKTLDQPFGDPTIFDFQVQLRANDQLPIEDATAVWSEGVAPFQTVATISIPKQAFYNAYQETECEHMSFTPWHGLTAHQPLGGINRLRLGAYVASSQHRSQLKEMHGFPKWPQ